MLVAGVLFQVLFSRARCALYFGVRDTQDSLILFQVAFSSPYLKNSHIKVLFVRKPDIIYLLNLL